MSEEVAGGDVYVSVERRDGHGWCFWQGRSPIVYVLLYISTDENGSQGSLESV